MKVKSSEYNDDLKGFIVTLEDGRTVQVQFFKVGGTLDADNGLHFPLIDRENDYGLSLTEEEEAEFWEWMHNEPAILAKACEFDSTGMN